MKTTADVNWYDDYTTDTIYVAAKTYGVAVKEVKQIGDNEICATVEGDEESVNAFVDDADEGDVMPFDNTAAFTDDEYEDWLKTKLAELGKSYSPKA